jgi:hypothetical protein
MPRSTLAPRSASSTLQRGLTGAMLGAAVVFIALLGAVAVTDSPRQISDLAGMVASAEVFEIIPPSAEASGGHSQAQAPATAVHDDAGLQAAYESWG